MSPSCDKSHGDQASSQASSVKAECRSDSSGKRDAACVRILKRLFFIQLILLVVTCGFLVFSVMRTKWKTTSTSERPLTRYLLHSSQPTPFEDLNEKEASIVKAYVTNILNLTNISKARITDSYLYNIILDEPWSKREGRSQRYATAIVFHGSFGIPVVTEYRVGPLSPAPAQPLTLKPSRSVPFQKRPLSTTEYVVLKALVDKAAEELKLLLKRHYNATLQTKAGETGSHILVHQYTSTMVSDEDEHPSDSDKGRTRIRNTWFRFTRNIRPFYQHPIDFQVRVIHNGVNTKLWRVDKIWFRGKTFNTTQSLLDHYANQSYKAEKIKPFRREERANFKSKEWTDSLPDMIQVDKDNLLTFKNWRLNVAFRSETGLRLFHVFYKGQRVLHELGLAETSTVYKGYTPFLKRLYSIESMFGVGVYTFNLKAGFDCPRDAIYFSAWVIQESIPKRVERAVCVFGHHSQADMYSDGNTAAVTVRSVTTLFNYDYVFDYIFHASGAIEVSVTASGNIHVEHTVDAENGMRINNGPLIFALDGTPTNLYGPVHHHFFHFKADFDIIEEENSLYANIIEPASFTQRQKQLATELYDAELTSTGEHYLTQCRNRASTCCYRVINKAVSKNENVPKMFGYETSTSWNKYPLRVTRRKINESRSSIMYNGVDPAQPEVNFDDFLDNDSIVNTDLVTWFTMTMLHIPHSEDLPFTNMPGGALRTYLVPTNFTDCLT